MYRSGDNRSDTELFNDIFVRLRKLEDAVTRRCLPVGYSFLVNSSGDLVVVRDSDGTTSTVIV